MNTKKVSSDIWAFIAWASGAIGTLTLIPLMIGIYYVVGNTGAQLFCGLCCLIIVTSYTLTWKGIVGASQDK